MSNLYRISIRGGSQDSKLWWITMNLVVKEVVIDLSMVWGEESTWSLEIINAVFNRSTWVKLKKSSTATILTREIKRKTAEVSKCFLWVTFLSSWTKRSTLMILIWAQSSTYFEGISATEVHWWSARSVRMLNLKIMMTISVTTLVPQTLVSKREKCHSTSRDS